MYIQIMYTHMNQQNGLEISLNVSQSCCKLFGTNASSITLIRNMGNCAISSGKSSVDNLIQCSIPQEPTFDYSL